MNEQRPHLNLSLFPRADNDASVLKDAGALPSGALPPGMLPSGPTLAREDRTRRHRLSVTPIPFRPSRRRIDLPTMMKGGLAAAGEARSRIAEEFRVTVVRTLHNLRVNRAADALPNVMLITSAIPGEGKTFTAFNLAASIASSGLGNALLVDTDAKLGSLSSILEVGKAGGLLNYAADVNATLDDFVYETGVTGLHFLPIGAYSATSEDGSVVRPMGTAIERISRELPEHVVVLDCAPCLSSSDAVAFAPFVAQIVLVVEAGRTQRSELDMSLELIRSCPNITLVLNKMRFTTTATFGAYYPSKWT